METLKNPRDLARSTFAVLFILILMAASLWILSPFLPAMIWAATIVVATWPLMLGLQKRLWGRRSLAVAVMTLLLLLVVVVPVLLTIATILQNVERISSFTQTLASVRIPPPPAWVPTIPFVGAKLQTEWLAVAALQPEAWAARLSPYVGGFVRWLAGKAGGLGLLFVHFMLMTAIAAILYARGETAAAGAQHFARRLAGSRGEASVALAGQAIRAVALGVIVTAFIQAALGGIGLFLAGIPFPGALTLSIFVLSVAQLGVFLVMGPAVVWLYWSGAPYWGTGLLVYTILVGSLDNVLRPILIRRGADLSILLILAGVIGGLIAFGIIGLFIGPVVLAIAYTLLAAWVAEDREPVPDPLPPPDPIEITGSEKGVQS
jgi:predicted PurR-regulated permease PerM